VYAKALPLLAFALTAGCAGGAKPDIGTAKRFDSFPLYWVGERFEHWNLESRTCRGPRREAGVRPLTAAAEAQRPARHHGAV
jgi:hypothetical protein